MKAILSLIISGALVVSGYAQTRNVLVGTNNTVVQPTNFWSADASNARTGLGLGTAATNDASAFQPSSATLSNLASSNAVNLTNLRATNLVGLIPTSNIPATTLTNIGGTLAITQGGTGATNIGNARTNLGATSIGDAVFTATNAAAARTAIGALATNGDATNLTNFPANLLRTNGNGSGLANLTAANITGTVALASNVTGTIAISNGGTGATNAATARTNLGLDSTNNAFSSLSVGVDITNSSTSSDASSAFGRQITIDSTVENSIAVGFGHSMSNFGVGAGGSVLLGGRGVMTNWGAFLFNGVEQGGTIGYSKGNSTFTVIASNGIYLDGPIKLIDVQGAATDTGILQISAGGGISRVMTNKSTATPAFFGWNGFSNLAFSIAESRTNLGLAWSALTNSNAGTSLVSVDTNGIVVSPTNFWQVAPISTTVQYQTNVTGTSTNVATNSRNLFLFSLAPSVSGVTNTVTLPTNAATTFDGDRATIIHLATNSANAVTAIRQLGAATNLITLNQVDEAVLLMYRGGQWRLADNLSFIEPIYFSGTNAAANAAASRTNLGLGANAAVAFGSLVLGTATDQLELISETTNSFELNYRTNGIAASSITFDSSQIVFNKPINFDSTNTVATTRANLGLGTNSAVVFASVNASLDTGDSNGIVFQSKIDFDDVRSENIVEKTRTNLGLGATWLTNTNVTNFRTDIGLGGTNNVTFSNITASGTLTTTSTVTAKTNLVVEGFVDFTTNHTNATPVTPNTPARWLQIRVGTDVFYLPAHQ